MTLTVRTDKRLQQALQRRARSLGKTVSELVREILAEAVAHRPLKQRAGHVKGQLELPEPVEPWRQHLKESNWRG